MAYHQNLKQPKTAMYDHSQLSENMILYDKYENKQL